MTKAELVLCSQQGSFCVRALPMRDVSQWLGAYGKWSLLSDKNWELKIIQSQKSDIAPVPYPTVDHSEQKCAHFFSEWCIVGHWTGAVWDSECHKIIDGILTYQFYIEWAILDSIHEQVQSIQTFLTLVGFERFVYRHPILCPHTQAMGFLS